MKLERIDGIPEGLNFQVLVGRAVEDLREQNLAEVEFLHIGKLVSDDQIKFVLDNSPKLSVIRITCYSCISSFAKKLIFLRGVKLVSGTFRGLQGSRYQALPLRYQKIRNKLLKPENASARFLIRFLADHGSRACELVWIYLCLDNKSDLIFGPSIPEARLAAGYSGNVTHGEIQILGVILYVLPNHLHVTDNLVNVDKYMTTLSVSLSRLHQQIIAQRQHIDRSNAWLQELGISIELHNLLNKKQFVSSLQSLKVALYLRRYSENLTERGRIIMRKYYIDRLTHNDIGNSLGISRSRIQHITNLTMRKLFFIHQFIKHPKNN